MLQKTILILLISLSNICFSQAPPEQSFYALEKPTDSGEDLILVTDRQIYCTDEKIYFTAGYNFNHPIDKVQWSKVLYVELIRWNGAKIAQGKFKLNDTIASGYLTIPNTLLSGNYYLRAYTKWMRNFPLENYFYTLIKVINPFESEIDTGPVHEPGKKVVQISPAMDKFTKSIECFTDKPSYKQREKVELTIRLNNEVDDYSSYCVSVAKVANIDTNTYYIQIPDEKSPDEKSLIYLPEIRGISISGKIIHTGAPIDVTNPTLHLSTPQNWEYFSAFQTRDNKSFYFTLPDFYGQYDFYIEAELEDEESVEILVDNDYCNRSVQLSYIPFSLDSAEMEIALDMALNMQLSKMYNENNSIPDPDSAQLHFYAGPKHAYYTEKYIQLPNLEEFFFELVKEVRTIRIKKQAYLKILAYSQYNDLQPLILLDNIPVFDVEEFLKIPLDKIEKVEIVNKPYIVSGRKYSGVICVSTKKKDFAGIKLGKNNLFFSYNLLSEGNYISPYYSSEDSGRVTYRQNLLYWDPDIKLNENHPKTLSFYTSDSKGEYIVYVRSINPKEKSQLLGSCKIVVE